jgi:hypothetical protein
MNEHSFEDVVAQMSAPHASSPVEMSVGRSLRSPRARCSRLPCDRNAPAIRIYRRAAVEVDVVPPPSSPAVGFDHIRTEAGILEIHQHACAVVARVRHHLLQALRVPTAGPARTASI